MGRGKHFQARTLERVDALAFEGTELLAACKEDPLFGFALMQRLLGVVCRAPAGDAAAGAGHVLAGGGTGGSVTGPSFRCGTEAQDETSLDRAGRAACPSPAAPTRCSDNAAAEAMMKKDGCAACHEVDKKLIGPAVPGRCRQVQRRQGRGGQAQGQGQEGRHACLGRGGHAAERPCLRRRHQGARGLDPDAAEVERTAPTGSREPDRDHAAARASRSRGSARSRGASSPSSSNLAPEVRWDHPLARLSRRAGQRLPAVAHGRGEWQAGRDARGDLPRLHGAARAQAPADRDRLRRDRRRIPGWRAGCSRAFKDVVELAVLAAVRLRALPALRAEAARGSSATARRCSILSLIVGDHGHRFRVRRLPLRACSPAATRRSPTSAASPSSAARWPRRSPALRPEARCDAGYQLVVLDPDADGARVPRDPAGGRALPHRHRAARRSSSAAAGPRNRVPTVDLEARWAATTRRTMTVGVRTARDLDLEGRARRVHLHRVRPLQGRLSRRSSPASRLSLKWVNDSLKQHLVEQREAIVAGDATRRCRRWSARSSARRRCGPARPAAIARRRARSSSSICRKFFRMRQHRVMMEGAFPHELKAVFDAYEVAEQSWGLPADTRGDWAHGLGVPCRDARRGRAGTRLPVLRRLGGVVRPARAEDRRARSRRILQQAGVKFAILGAARDARPASACAAPATRCCSSSSRARWSATLNESRRHADRDLRSARVQLAAERVSGVRRALRGDPSHAAHRAAAGRGPHRGRADASSA